MEIQFAQDFGLTNCFGNELAAITTRSILDFRPAYCHDLTRLFGCRNHPRFLRRAPLATRRNKRNKRTRGVCVTLFYIYAGACKQARMMASTRASRSRESREPWIRKERRAEQEQIVDFSDESVFRSVDRPIFSTNRVSPLFIVFPISLSALPRAIQFSREKSSACCSIDHLAVSTTQRC